MYSYVQPIIAIAVSITIGMDTLTWQKVLATALVFGGLVIVSRSRSANQT
jgi:drug/metabolite transporter (DMT)-like permease